MNQTADIWSSISSVLNGNPTLEEKRQVENWVAANKTNKQFFDHFQGAKYNESIEKKASEAKYRIYIKTQAKINEVPLRFKLRIWKYIAVASMILLILTGGIGLFQKNVSAPPIWVESKSSTGSTSKLTLSDGTVVVLNANSSINYPLSFNNVSRTVKLEGEAYFEVSKDIKRPFIVETNSMSINVIGTHFNIRSYNEDNKAITTLLSGSVGIEINDRMSTVKKTVILKPGEQITLDRTTHQTEINKVNADLYISWKEGQCFFENEKFIDVTKMLERQFGIEISILSSGLENQIYSGFFTKKEGVLQILNSFRKYRNFDYRLDDNRIVIYERDK